MEEIDELKQEIKELKNKVTNLEIDVKHMKATEIVKARLLEDSVLNRSLLKDISSILTEGEKVEGLNANTREMLKEVIESDDKISVIQFLKDKKKINAIKMVREITGAGLKDAKKITEEIQKRFNIPS